MKDFLEKFNDSYERVLGALADKDHFFQDFYIEFISRSPEINEKFANTDLNKQARMLKKSLTYMVNFFVNKKSSDYLEEIAWLHSFDKHDIRPNLYEEWTESLIKSVADHDPHFDPDIELAWRIVMAPGIEFMKFHYQKLKRPN